MSTNKVQHFKHFVNNKTQFQINHAKCRLSQFVVVTFSAAFYSFGHFARRPFKIVYQPAATCDAARVAFICTFVFHLMTMLKCSLPNGLHANRRQTKKMRKSGRKNILKCKCYGLRIRVGITASRTIKH